MRRLLLAGAILLSACSSPTGPQMAELVPLASTIPVRAVWAANVGKAEDAILYPAVVEGAVFAASQEGIVARFDAATGREAWRVDVHRTLSGGVGSDGSLVAFGTFEGDVIVLDAAKGGLAWQARVSSEVLSAPVVTGDLVIVRTGDGRLFALDAKDGKRRWLYQRTSPPLSVRSPVGMVAEGGTLYTGFAGGKLVSISLANGGVRWEATVSLPHGATELERVTDVVGLPVVAGREVCTVAFQGRVGCFDVTSGNASWSREMSSTAGIAVDSRYVFVSDDKGSVQALDRAGGATVWKQDKLFLRRLTAPLVLGDVVAVGDVEGYVHFLSRETGAFVGRVATDGSPIRTSLLPLGKGFLVQTQEGNLFALTPG